MKETCGSVHKNESEVYPENQTSKRGLLVNKRYAVRSSCIELCSKLHLGQATSAEAVFA